MLQLQLEKKGKGYQKEGSTRELNDPNREKVFSITSKFWNIKLKWKLDTVFTPQLIAYFLKRIAPLPPPWLLSWLLYPVFSDLYRDLQFAPGHPSSPIVLLTFACLFVQFLSPHNPPKNWKLRVQNIFCLVYAELLVPRIAPAAWWTPPQ